MRPLGILLLFAFAPMTTYAARACADGDAWTCLHDGESAEARGDRPAALAAFSAACGGNVLDGCLAEGRLRITMGDLAGAEPPLRRVQEDDRGDGYDALADLYDARAQPAVAQQLRRDGLAIEQPDAEFVSSFRVGRNGLTRNVDEGYVMALRIHPMAFDSRRVTFGAQFVFGPGFTEGLATIGLQHFVTDWFILYGEALAGARSGTSPLDAGAQGGIEFALGGIGHFDVGVGSTVGMPLYFSVGVGLNWVLMLEAALQGL